MDVGWMHGWLDVLIWMDGWMDWCGWTHGCRLDDWKHGYMERCVEGYFDGRLMDIGMDNLRAGCMDGWIDERVDRWMYGWMLDGCVDRRN